MSTTTAGTLSLTKVGRGELPGTWDTPINANFDRLETAYSAVVTIGLSGSAYAVSSSAAVAVYTFTGGDQACTVTLPGSGGSSIARLCTVVNRTAYNLTFRVGTGITTSVIASNNSALLYVSVDDVFTASSPAVGGSDASAITSGVFDPARLPTITRSKMESLAPSTLMGNPNLVSSPPSELTVAAARTMLGLSDAQIVTILGGYKSWAGTQAAYDAIPVKDANTLYFIHA